MTLRDGSNCFACGKDNPIGLHLKVEEIERGARAEFIPSSLYEGYIGYLHGGIISSLLDEIMVWAAKFLGYKVVTAELTVRFKRPVPVNERLTVEGRVTDKKKKLLSGEASIYNNKGEVLATATEKMFEIQ